MHHSLNNGKLKDMLKIFSDLLQNLKICLQMGAVENTIKVSHGNKVLFHPLKNVPYQIRELKPETDPSQKGWTFLRA